MAAPTAASRSDAGCGTNQTPPSAMAVSTALKDASTSTSEGSMSARRSRRISAATSPPISASSRDMRLCQAMAASTKAPASPPLKNKSDAGTSSHEGASMDAGKKDAGAASSSMASEAGKLRAEMDDPSAGDEGQGVGG